ncbi:MAG: aldolase/citrate lyase family protein [Gemmatimonadota bacterium]
MTGAVALLTGLALAGCGGGGDAGDAAEEAVASASLAATPSRLIELWNERQAAFGIFVPSERARDDRGPDGERLPPLYTAEGAQTLAANPLLDYLFLNLEGAYDPSAVTAMMTGLEASGSDLSLLVRIPPISTDGEEAARQRVHEILGAGAHGVVMPHVRSEAEATLAISFFEEVGADVWSPENPDGTIFAMLMVEDPGALAELGAIASLPGYSVLACGIGSLTRALDGDREAAEAGNQDVLVAATEAGLADMITANVNDVAQRVEEGFLGLLMGGPGADEAIQAGREAAGR